MKKVILLHIILISSCALFAQNEQKAKELLKKGNEEFRANHFLKASKHYKAALEEDGNYYKALFNLGASHFSRNEFKEASEQFENAALTAESKEEKASAYYNLGCSYTLDGNSIVEQINANPAAAQEAGDPISVFKDGAEAFKNALRNDPTDEDARYNLAFVQKWLEQNQPQQDENQDGEDENQDGEDEDKSEKEENKDGENDKDSENKEENDSSEDGDKKDQDQQDQQQQKEQEQQQQQMSKEDAQRILEAIDRNEKEIRQKMNLKKARGNKIKIEKDW